MRGRWKEYREEVCSDEWLVNSLSLQSPELFLVIMVSRLPRAGAPSRARIWLVSMWSPGRPRAARRGRKNNRADGCFRPSFSEQDQKKKEAGSK